MVNEGVGLLVALKKIGNNSYQVVLVSSVSIAHACMQFARKHTWQCNNY